jgi:ABC-type sugar transport system ATPase subunit
VAVRAPDELAIALIRLAAFGTQATTASVVERLRAGDLLERLPATLSGGEQRRVEVALAIVRAPQPPPLRLFLRELACTPSRS